MTKTLFGKKLLLLATITVLVTGLTLASTTFDDAEAKKDKEPKEPKTRDLKCKDNVGSFMPIGPGAFVSTGESKCKSLGHAAFTSITALTGAAGVSGDGCLELVGAGALGGNAYDGYGISKKGFFTTTVDAGMEQCFLDSAGVALGAAWDGTFCEATATSAHDSIVTGGFTITGGLIKGNVPTGSGVLSSAVDHCAGGTAPNGDSVITTLTGTITY